MKTNDHYEDKALRQTMAEQAQSSERMQLPDGFADQVMNRIHEETEHSHRTLPLFRKVAAIFIGAILLSGLAYAAWIQVHTGTRTSVEQVTKKGNADNLVVFNNTHLDAILDRVCRHYNRRVSYTNKELREWRFQITWDSTKPLAEFIGLLNEFDGIRVTDRDNTIIVENKEKKE